MAEARKIMVVTWRLTPKSRPEGWILVVVTYNLLTLEVTMRSLMEECTMSSKSQSSLRKHPTTKREMMHRHWYMGVTAIVLTMRMTTTNKQDEDTV